MSSFRKNLLRSKSALRRRRGGLSGGGRGGFVKGALLVGGGVLAGAAINQSMQGQDGQDGADGQDADPETMKKMVDDKFVEYEVEQKSQGGKVKKLPQRSQGDSLVDHNRIQGIVGRGEIHLVHRDMELSMLLERQMGELSSSYNNSWNKTQPHLTQKEFRKQRVKGIAFLEWRSVETI